MYKYNPLLRKVIISAILLLGSFALLFVAEKPAKAQAQELFELYFEMDHVRQDSARIFAELMEVESNPARVGAVEEIGSPPPLSSQEELVLRLEESQISVEQFLAAIDENKFTDPEVDRRYDQVRAFYATLFEFEDLVLAELSTSDNTGDQFAFLVNTIFEGEDWPALLAEDVQLKDTLASLAELHGLEFSPLSYDELFGERLIELRTPIISEELREVHQSFTVREPVVNHVIITVEFDIILSEKIKVTLEGPSGNIIALDQLVDGENSQEGPLSFVWRMDNGMFIKLFPDDPLVMPISGEWIVHITVPVGCQVVIGVSQL